ncbi:uncharacterized protein M421DRAFT_73991 [Didymella exigua CBS 183.55]|uniref:Zn(2)-C6 fungal-type domain-containing protein n=1 Tax=Didymella exigua CBS 183.55 TaxID=1150837 RepID=A0A6A5R887_9PLEO|nr:uncharacterized protein M421DRAFT_73991 [Didymella exigua CBS 183.55]KAF1923942.1 hypothetical protein M421DRAFT_73991 [Didymella exigua CBS 183.55]
MPQPHKEKLHAACDECRTRKLKCSGDKPCCGRCRREEMECVYSPRKTMGRPRKRRREEGDELDDGAATIAIQDGHESIDGFTGFGLVDMPEFALHAENEVYAQDTSLAGVAIYEPFVDTSLIDPSPIDTSLIDPSPIDTSPIDPSLWDAQAAPSTQPSYAAAIQATPPYHAALGPCICLSLTYLTLTELQTVPTLSFPRVLQPLRHASGTIATVLRCPTCPLDRFSAMQNVSSISALFKALLERFSNALREIDAEADRLRAARATKPFRMGDGSPALAHLHTGAPDCPLGFDVALDPDVWRALVKTALRAEVDGGGSNPMPLAVLLEEAEERQGRWHRDERFLGGEGRGEDGGKCESLGAEHVRRAMGMLDWS